MDEAGALVTAAEFLMREMALFAATGFLLLGLSDPIIDLLWFGQSLQRFLPGEAIRPARVRAHTIGEPERPGGIAIFVPAWDEAALIGKMLRHAVATFDHRRYTIFVGCYPNDEATITAVEAVRDKRVRLVIGHSSGPTTKADCLNRIWERMLEDEAASGERFKAIVLHDAEDVVHSAELRVFDRLIELYDLVQLPVLPLIDPNSRWVAGHYADEFAQSHVKEMAVREALGAAMPSAGVGCAFARNALDEIARRSGGYPFDRDSLTEDYELGLRIHAIEGKPAFVRLPASEGRPVVMTREYFPGTLDAAVRQKARWMTGIALSGWDRMGWSGGLAERWMRLRDRQSVLAALLLFAGYAALLLWGALSLPRILSGGRMVPISPALALLLAINGWLFAWRLVMRFSFVTKAYGWREGLLSLPRVVVGNMIAMLAARRAVIRYLGIRRTGEARWDKTAHAFPGELPAE